LEFEIWDLYDLILKRKVLLTLNPEP